MSQLNQDYDLIKRYHDNDYGAQKELLKRYERLIWYLVYQIKQRHRYIDLDLDDMYQEGLIALHDAIMNFDKDKNVPLYCLAKVCISRKINSFVKRFSRNIYQSSFLLVSLDSIINEDERFCLHEVIADENHYDVQYHLMIESYLSILDDRESKIINMRIQGYKYQEIARHLSITSKDVDNAIQKIRRKIKTYE
ncbi:MAG: sigma-70 family RNA polymerase sigma factor, partial [Erysipelotrichaceae bacterium]|nr:sigma-70 family RNA polymerase sigma factor [Erysipelotrichaceae bacterium]MDD3924981.1 sigma-70 family RNA polymerase sigma factor [Erysipelotrichaceae bacterium]MDD4643255.1 sigma-70 family RNA polymerase sigma factor [Erysipelotrichaceae bacterium]